MSQTLPDLILSPCPIREHRTVYWLRLQIALASDCEGISWHPNFFEGAIVVNWKRYHDFDDAPSGELLSCSQFPLRIDDEPILEHLDWLRENLPQIPREGATAGTFHAVAEKTRFPVDVRLCDSGIFFRLHGHLDRPCDFKRLVGYDWAPEGMERHMQFEEEDVVHFIPKKPPKTGWKFWRRSARPRGCGSHCELHPVDAVRSSNDRST